MEESNLAEGSTHSFMKGKHTQNLGRESALEKCMSSKNQKKGATKEPGRDLVSSKEMIIG